MDKNKGVEWHCILCGFVAKAKTKEELKKKIIEHFDEHP